MKLTSKGRYAVMALVDLARFDTINPVSLRDISLRQGISLDYLEQIFSKLKKNQIVKSTRGTQGGYVLSKKPNEIKLNNIFNAVDEKVKTVQCKKESKKGCNGIPNFLYVSNSFGSTSLRLFGLSAALFGAE